MRNQFLSLKGVIFLTALFSYLQLAAQNSDCKVLIPEISGTYVGDCKSGLAHGKGTATGKDRYEGQFNKGLPNGRGTYTWSDGTLYRGEWSKGIREGRGEMIYVTARGDSVVNGYWKGGNYAGKDNIPSYSVIRKDNLLSVNLRKTGTGDGVIIKLMRKGQVNSSVRGLSIVSTSGTIYKAGRYEGIQSVRYPLDIKITYNTNNPISRSSFDVVFECTINEPGKWEIVLNN
jgi:hypothetical protein